MKTTVRIIGVGDRRTGTGKTGKPYDIVSVAFTYADARMNGFNAGSCVLDGNMLDQHNIGVGTEHEAFIMFRDYKPYIAAIL